MPNISDTSFFCPCGEPAIELSRAFKRCARCKAIEERNEKWLRNYHPNCLPKQKQQYDIHWWVQTAKMIDRGYEAFAEKRGWPKVQFNA